MIVIKAKLQVFLHVEPKVSLRSNAKDVDVAVVKISDTPSIGEKKKGDLANLWVYKLKSNGQLYLLGYTMDADIRLIYLEAIGSHENFYRDMKNK